MLNRETWALDSFDPLMGLCIFYFFKNWGHKMFESSIFYTSQIMYLIAIPYEQCEHKKPFEHRYKTVFRPYVSRWPLVLLLECDWLTAWLNQQENAWSFTDCTSLHPFVRHFMVNKETQGVSTSCYLH